MHPPLPSLWFHASWREGARRGVAELGLGDLYLGLLATGGDAARLLGRHGITLASARDRVGESSPVAEPAAARAGLKPPPDTLTDPEELAPRCSAPARAALDSLRRAPDTFAVLVGLLKQSEGVVRELVAADGVLPNDLVGELKAGSDDPLAAAKVAADTTRLVAPARAHRVRGFVPVPRRDAVRALGDADLLAWWAYDPEEGTGADTDPATVTFGATRVRYHLAHRTGPGDATITWVTEALDGDRAGRAIGYDDFDLSEAPGGTEVWRTSARSSASGMGRLLAPAASARDARSLVRSTAALAYGITGTI